jgi:hypothetical protein
MLVPAGASELQWRTGPSPTAKSTRPATQQRFMPPRQASYRLSSTVRLAQFEEPSADPAGDFDSPMRSVVVDRDEATGSVRSAQLPPMRAADAETTVPAPDADLPANDGLPANVDLPANADLPANQDGQQPPNPFGDLPDDTPQFQPPMRETPSTEFQPALPPAGGGLGDALSRDLPTASEDVIEEERQKAAAACSQSLGSLQTKTIDQVVLSIAVSGNEGVDYPFECSIDLGEWHPGRAWAETTYLWKASALCHKPLYFEDEQLERYGHSFAPCCQPLISGAHFFCTLPVLPYCMGVSPPMECEYALGHYRPGSCAPYMLNPVPISCRGALIQAGAVTGAAAVLP